MTAPHEASREKDVLPGHHPTQYEDIRSSVYRHMVAGDYRDRLLEVFDELVNAATASPSPCCQRAAEEMRERCAERVGLIDENRLLGRMDIHGARAIKRTFAAAVLSAPLALEEQVRWDAAVKRWREVSKPLPRQQGRRKKR